MNALKNVVHYAALGLWALAGVLVSFSAGATGSTLLTFWAWFAGYLAVSTMLVVPARHPVAALATHAGLVLVMSLLPTAGAIAVLRIGLDAVTALLR
jgi:hypothetical protein